MQRRAAAIFVAFFLVIGAGAYSLIATAHTPTIGFENPEHELQQGDNFQVEGQTYNVTSITAEVESGGGGGHGGGGGSELVREGEVAWTNQSATYTTEWKNNSTVTLDNESYRVLVQQASGNPTTFTLREEINETAILQNDSAADNQTVKRDDGRYVVVEDANGTTLVPVDEYFPEPSSQQYSENETLTYQGNQTTVAAVENETVTLEWTAPKTNTATLSDEGNVTLGGKTYLAQFPSNDTVVLTQDFASYQEQTNEIHEFQKHKNGLWGIVILCGTLVMLLTGMAYLPSRY